MNDKRRLSRRNFLKGTGAGADGRGSGRVAIPAVHAAQDSTVQIALVGCGGRGTGAAQNALGVQNGPIKLVAMADVFEDRLNTSHKALQRQVRGRRSTCPTTASSSASTATRTRSIACGRATWRFLRRRRRFAGCISNTPSRRASTSSWRSR